MLKLSDILDLVKTYHPQPDLDLIRKAYVCSAKYHEGQVRKSGEPYLSHPLEVAKILAELKLDEASICTGLLHDTVEDTAATQDEIEEVFGHDIAYLVDGVTKLSQIKFYSSEEKQAENFRKMLVAMSRDIRVLLVKLADRLHNMRTLQYMIPEKQERIATETIEIYAPLANRLGIAWLKAELEDLSFKYIKPWDYRNLREKIGKTKNERARFIEDVSRELEKTLNDAGMKNFEVEGRPKHLWSVFRKMSDKGLSFDEIHDLIAFRVVVETLGQCYEALGHIHAQWRPIPGRFKDYIAMPKPNGYRSLHTTLVGPKGERIEVQIRTRRMHEVAESGIAAHWKYKAHGGGVPLTVDEASEKNFQWLRQLMNWQKDLTDPNEFLESVKVDLFSEEVYVFTPRGDVIELPRGATPVDMAFAIHSAVGMQCIGAKVNNRIVPLRYVLENGDSCEIITQKNQRPKKDWLEFVKTSRARTKIRAVMRQLERDRSKEIGRELLERELRRYGTSIQRELKSGALDRAVKNKRCANFDEALALVGYGKLEAKAFAEECIPEEEKREILPEQKRSRISQLFDKLARRGSGGIRVEGVDDVLVHYARCCSPVKGDPVIGFVTRGRGVSIHRRNCPKIMELDADRKISVSWVSDSELVRPISITVLSDDREGMLTDLSAVFARMNINISEAKCRGLGDGQAINTFKCGVHDLAQLNLVMRKLGSLKGVHRVERSSSNE
ncbi:MAG: bifunctional (p)ppGpp synthetase/guanosine-3',5'-bis(diphosphate) 3'-pyrophosphohydrolase [Myxococcales bacterium]|nr:MAG: bifunctional (p)ppGpp synthetase/guanosine-3',5'-bis(diphosphate) 3'-pyrophosphohydrolase [Myxococcales bacterium]